jgi:solute:Na+ symporter, SSS family
MDTGRVALHGLDWIVLVVYFAGMLAVGFYFSHRNKNSDDYMLGGRKMTAWRVGLSFFATMFSTVSYLSMPGEMVKNGPMMWSFLLAFPFIYIIVAVFFIPYIMTLKISSAYELLELRLGLKNRLLASVYFLIMRLVWMAVIIYMCAEKVIVPIMGWPADTALWISITMGIITIVYTSFGGLQGVVLTDVIQTFILFGGSILAIFVIIGNLGSVSAIIPKHWPEHWQGWVFFDSQARVSFLTAFLSMFGWHVCTAGSDQMAIQRYLATRDARAAQKMYLSHIVSNILVFILLAILGLSVMAFFSRNPMLIPQGKTIESAADLLFPRFIVMGLPIGLSGLMLAALFAAAMSSLSSGINSSCLVIIKDFISVFHKNFIDEKKQVRLAKIISIAIGLVVVVLSLGIGQIKGNLLEMTYKTINLLTAPLFVPFFMAMFVKSAKPTATFIGTLFSGLVAALISYANELFSVTIPFLWIIPGSFIAGVAACWILGVTVFKQEKATRL